MFHVLGFIDGRNRRTAERTECHEMELHNNPLVCNLIESNQYRA